MTGFSGLLVLVLSSLPRVPLPEVHEELTGRGRHILLPETDLLTPPPLPPSVMQPGGILGSPWWSCRLWCKCVLIPSLPRKSEHITPVLRSLHWLPVTFRIDFKVLLLVYKSLNGLGPKYIADMLTEYKPNRPLRSLGSSQLEIPRVHTKQGESAFSYYAARSWNQLPEEIKCAKTLATFKSSLKTNLFSCAFVEWALCYVRTDCIVFYV